ncbi:M13 family peptidase [Croceicoccus ponticola]|uniref:M13 family peptidase n=1 Tax=Croceicoccus ponticola TaxID=2217664 RepID=A0A437GYT5_9SPHN|nr:M13 family metallopeptidase [Croceicoccus ponticola]RVQ67610.1 M13 family peptidase [Croceicoccus ponticola]
MKRIILAAGCSVLTLALYAPASAQDAAATAAPQVVDPEFMTWPKMGFDPADLDPAVDPGDDFHAYVNGKWDKATPIPPQFQSYGVVTDLRLKSEAQVEKIIVDMSKARAPAGSIEQKVGDSYAAFVDRKAIEAKGMGAAQPYLNRIWAIDSHEALARFFAEPGMPDPFSSGVRGDDLDPNRNIFNLWTGGLGLPDRDNYLVDSEKNVEMREKYKEYLTFLLGKAGYEDPAAAAVAVYGLERRMAVTDWDRTMSRNPRLLYNPVSRTDLVAMTGNFPLQTYLDGIGVGGIDTIVVDELPPSAAKIAELGITPADLAKLGGGFPAFAKLIGDTDLATWKAWAAAGFLGSYATVLPKDIEDAQFAFWGDYMGGQKVQRPREKLAISLINGRLGEAVGKIYVDRNFSPEAKAKMVELVSNLRTVMGHRIEGLTWMSDATKAQSLDKLSKFTVKIGYPDKWEDYDGLDVKADDALGNSIAATKWSWGEMIEDLGKPVDRIEWGMTPQTVNAYYNGSLNEIVFPAAYLQAPNFSLSADPAVNYAIIGSTIGHEISHGFDDQGSMYDGDGVLRNWWTPEDRAKFDAAAEKLVAQYDAFCPLDDGKTCINGKLTLGENIADLAGVRIAYDAYKLSLGGKAAPVIDGLTGEQRFFIALAVGARGKWTEALTRQILQTDPHSPDKARTNVVLANFDPWYEAFNVTADDAMYLPPEKRVHMW